MNAKTANSKRPDISGNNSPSSNREGLTAAPQPRRQRLGHYSIFAAFPALLFTNSQEAWADAAKKTESSLAARPANLTERLNKVCGKPALLKRQSAFRLPRRYVGFAMPAAFTGNDDCPGRAVPGGNYTAAAPYIDAGDTTGANDTVKTFYMYSFGYQTLDSSGPDHVYSFTLTGRGPNPQIEVSTTSGTYSPLIYVLQGGYAGACPAGTGKHADNGLTPSESSPSGAATINSQRMNFLPLNVPLHLFVDSARNDAGGSGPYTIRMQDVTISSSECDNPIDCPEFFVRQHYLDFLNRVPEAAGFDFWFGVVNECGGDAECRRARRVNVSAAFFLSIEFQETGFLAYRAHKAAYGDLPGKPVPITMEEMLIGRWRLGENVLVGVGDWQARLEANKRAYFDTLVSSPRFAALFPQTQTPEQFVAALNANAGGVLSPAERDALAADLRGGAKTRAQALRATAEDDDLKRNEFNKAFVLMQYFGYLRRDPDSAPDSDYSGFNFWLAQLDRFGGDFRRAEMVRAFIESIEYRRRFSQ